MFLICKIFVLLTLLRALKDAFYAFNLKFLFMLLI